MGWELFMNKRKGNATTAITLTISFALLLVFTIYIINTILPFIWYQKLQAVVDKYVYVVEKFGYLTDSEEKELYKELEADGFDLQKIQLDCPKTYLEYGTLFKFEITYNLYQEYSVISDGIKNEARIIPLKIRKYGYSKI